VSVDGRVTTDHDDRFMGCRVSGEVVVAEHPEVHAVVAVLAPALPLFAALLTPIRYSPASVFACFPASFARVFTALPRGVALFLNRPVSLRLRKRGCR